MAEVDVDQIAAAFSGVRVERDRAQHTRIQPGVQTLEGVLPADCQARHLEHLGVGAVITDRDQRRLVVDPQRGIDDAAQVGRLQVQLGARGVELLLQLGEPGVEFHAAGQRRVDHLVGVDALGLAFGRGTAREVLLDLLADHLVDRAQVVFDLGDLLGDACP